MNPDRSSLLDPRATWLRFRLPGLACALLLLLCFVHALPAASEADASAVRSRGFAELSYSDVAALHADRGGTRHRLPYAQDAIEYPVLLGVTMYVPSLFAPRPAAYFAASFALQAAAALAVLWMMCRVKSARPWGWAVSPALLAYAQLNWDLSAIALLVAGLLAWTRGRERAAVTWVTLATWTKFFPVVALAPMFSRALADDRRKAIRLALLAVAVTVLVNAPFALSNPANWTWFFRFNSGRGIDSSLYQLVGLNTRTGVPIANAVSAGTMALAGLYILRRALRRQPLNTVAAAGALVTLWLFANKVFSPQYWLWVVASLALAGVPTPVTLLIGCLGAFEFVSTFGLLNHSGSGFLYGLQRFASGLYWDMLRARYVGLALAFAFLAPRAIARAGADADEPAREPEVPRAA